MARSCGCPPRAGGMGFFSGFGGFGSILPPQGITFVLDSSLAAHNSRAPSAHRAADEWRTGVRGRYVIVRLNKGGALPKRAEISQHSSADTTADAARVLASIQSMNPGTTFAIVDRLA